jgi:shikimate kinase
MSYFSKIRGPAGVGKSTIAKKVAKKLNAQYISFDAVMKKNKLDIIEGDGISAANFVKANNLVIPDILKQLKKGQIVLFDGCFYRAEQINHLKKQLNFKYLIFTLTATLDDCLTRNKSRRRIMSKEAIEEVYCLVKNLNIGIEIQTSGKTITDSVNEIILKSNKSASKF